MTRIWLIDADLHLRTNKSVLTRLTRVTRVPIIVALVFICGNLRDLREKTHKIHSDEVGVQTFTISPYFPPTNPTTSGKNHRNSASISSRKTFSVSTAPSNCSGIEVLLFMRMKVYSSPSYTP